MPGPPKQLTSEQLNGLADSLENQTAGLSVIRHAKTVTAFDEIASQGLPGIIIALQRLHGNMRPLWIYFLKQNTDSNPAETAQTISQASEAWLTWGHQRKLI
jgi:hypothetical protein